MSVDHLLSSEFFSLLLAHQRKISICNTISKLIQMWTQTNREHSGFIWLSSVCRQDFCIYRGRIDITREDEVFFEWIVDHLSFISSQRVVKLLFRIQWIFIAVHFVIAIRVVLNFLFHLVDNILRFRDCQTSTTFFVSLCVSFTIYLISEFELFITLIFHDHIFLNTRLINLTVFSDLSFLSRLD